VAILVRKNSEFGDLVGEISSVTFGVALGNT